MITFYKAIYSKIGNHCKPAPSNLSNRIENACRYTLKCVADFFAWVRSEGENWLNHIKSWRAEPSNKLKILSTVAEGLEFKKNFGTHLENTEKRLPTINFPEEGRREREEFTRLREQFRKHTDRPPEHKDHSPNFHELMFLCFKHDFDPDKEHIELIISKIPTEQVKKQLTEKINCHFQPPYEDDCDQELKANKLKRQELLRDCLVAFSIHVLLDRKR